MTALNLEASKKVYELLGDTYETEFFWDKWCEHIYPCVPSDHKLKVHSEADFTKDGSELYFYEPSDDAISAPNFSELIRLLPKIGEKKGWSEDVWDSNRINLRRMSHILAEIYMLAPTEEQGMEEVSKYLLKVL